MRPHIHATLSKREGLGDDDLALFRETEAYLGLYVRRHTAGEWWQSPESPIDLAIRFAYNTKGNLLDEDSRWMLYLDTLAQMVWSDVETGQSTDIVAYIHRYSFRRRRRQDAMPTGS